MSKSELVLVTGGAGFIGSHLVEALVDEGYRVRVVDNLATGHRSNLAHLEGRYEWIEGDLADFDVCLRAAEGVESRLSRGRDSQRPPLRPRAARIAHQRADGHAQHARGRAAGRSLAGSCSPHPAAPTATRSSFPSTRRCCPTPLSPYAAGKLAGEHYVSVYARTMGLDGVSLRYFNIFGPRQDPSSPYSGVISLFIKFMSQGQRPTIYGDGQQTRDFTYVGQRRGRQPRRPALSATRSWARSSTSAPASASACSTWSPRSTRSWEPTSNPIFLDPRAGDVRDSLASLDRIEKVLGYKPIVSFEEGLRRTVEATVGHGRSEIIPGIAETKSPSAGTIPECFLAREWRGDAECPQSGGRPDRRNPVPARHNRRVVRWRSAGSLRLAARMKHEVQRSRCSSTGTVPWCSTSAATCCGMTTRRKMPSRRRF